MFELFAATETVGFLGQAVDTLSNNGPAAALATLAALWVSGRASAAKSGGNQSGWVSLIAKLFEIFFPAPAPPNDPNNPPTIDPDNPLDPNRPWVQIIRVVVPMILQLFMSNKAKMTPQAKAEILNSVSHACDCCTECGDEA